MIASDKTRQRLFCVVDADGESYYVPAGSFGEATDLYMRWQRGWSDEVDAEYDEPQSVHDVGYLILVPDTIIFKRRTEPRTSEGLWDATTKGGTHEKSRQEETRKED